MQLVFVSFGKDQVNQTVTGRADYRVTLFLVGRMCFVYEFNGIWIAENVNYFSKLNRVFCLTSSAFSSCHVKFTISMIQIYTYL